MSFVLLSVVGYCSAMKAKYGVFGISKVTDANIYGMLKQNDLIDPFITDTMKQDIEIKLLNKHSYIKEAFKISEVYDWEVLHEIVQKSLNANFQPFLMGESITRMRLKEMGASLGMDFGDSAKPYLKNVFNFSLYHLVGLLLFHLFLMLYSYVVSRKTPLISFILNVWGWLNLITVLLSAPNCYGRLTAPSLLITLFIIIQCADWFVHFINKKEREFILP